MVLALAVPTSAQNQAVTQVAPTTTLPASSQASTSQASTSQSQAQSSSPAIGTFDSTLRVGVGDLIELNVYNVPELATRTRVGSNGDIYLPLIDYVHIDGLTLEEAQKLIEKRLSDGGFVKNPHVTLFVSEYASQAASVLGEVTKPGVYRVLGQGRLLDLISAAGGLTDRAGRSMTVTHRDHPDQPVTVPLSRNLTDNPESNIDVFPGDTVIVRKADIIYVVGEVARPSGFLMDSEELTVLKAVAMAGGTTRAAKLNSATIIRRGPDGATATEVQLKKILAAKSPDTVMQPNDILYVPTNTAKLIGTQLATAAIQAAAAVGVAVAARN